MKGKGKPRVAAQEDKTAQVYNNLFLSFLTVSIVPGGVLYG